MAKFKVQDGEQVLMEGLLPYLKSKYRYIPGLSYLTDRRFVHTNNLRGRAVGGLVGALMTARIDLEVPLETITGIGRSSHGRKHHPVLVILTRDGQDHRIVAEDEAWFQAFDRALAQRHPGQMS